MTDIVERLRMRVDPLVAPSLMLEAANEIERLRAALTYEENRFNRVGTHDPNCYKWGPSHYDCAMREIYSLQDNLAESLHLLEARDMEIERLGESIKQAKREAAEHILEMWRDPWPRKERRFIDRLESYVKELK
jgi:DNA repair ATPase RecN